MKLLTHEQSVEKQLLDSERITLNYDQLKVENQEILADFQHMQATLKKKNEASEYVRNMLQRRESEIASLEHLIKSNKQVSK